MRFVISATHPRTNGYYSEVSTDDEGLIQSEVVRLSRRGYTEIVTRKLTDEKSN